MSAVMAEMKPDDAAARSERPVTVLVVDDNLQNREVAEGHLVGAGYTFGAAVHRFEDLPRFT